MEIGEKNLRPMESTDCSSRVKKKPLVQIYATRGRGRDWVRGRGLENWHNTNIENSGMAIPFSGTGHWFHPFLSGSP